MNTIFKLMLLPVLLLSSSCDADNTQSIDDSLVNQLFKHFMTGMGHIATDKKPFYKTGDFNGDGFQDVAVLFVPDKKLDRSSKLNISMPWVYPGIEPSSQYRKSLVIFNGSKDKWLTDSTKLYVLLDTSGALETPSFELLVTKQSDRDFESHHSLLPVKTSNDLIIVPTEAGIDTYVYWDKGGYVLFESQEMP